MGDYCGPSECLFPCTNPQGCQKVPQVAVRDQVFQFRALPFGLATAPFVFSWFLRPFVKFLQASGIKIHTYLDDWIVHHRDQNTLLSHKDYVLQWAEQLGLQVNFQKSSLVPVQTVVFLGARLDLQSHLAFPSPEHLNRVKVCIGQILQGKLMSARHWSQLIGLLNFIASFIPFGRLALRPLQMHLSNHWDFDWTQEHKLLPHPQQILCHLRRWTQDEFLLQGMPFQVPSPTDTLFTDASLSGWGAHFREFHVSGLWDTQDQQLHINLLEMKPVFLAISRLSFVLRHQVIIIATDNTTVLSYLKRQGGTRSQSLLFWTQKVFQICQEIDLEFQSRHIPGRRNLLADQLSRRNQVVHSEWSLNQSVLVHLWSIWGLPQIDTFATQFNNRLPRYFSPLPDPSSEAVDALSQKWDRLFLYLFPPFNQIPVVLRKLRQSPSCKCILVFPRRQGAPRYPSMLDLFQERDATLFPLPFLSDLLFQPLSYMLHPNVQDLNLHAVLLLPRD